jgi:putative FmdB family regulatory protein
MPIHDYTCRACSHVFEHLTIRAGAGEPPVCPQCNSPDVEKLLSRFRVGPPVPTAAQKERQALERAGWVPMKQPTKRR